MTVDDDVGVDLPGEDDAPSRSRQRPMRCSRAFSRSAQEGSTRWRGRSPWGAGI